MDKHEIEDSICFVCFPEKTIVAFYSKLSCAADSSIQWFLLGRCPGLSRRAREQGFNGKEYPDAVIC